MLFTCKGKMSKKCFIKFVCQSKGWSTKHICKGFLIKKWAVRSVEDQCKIQKMNTIDWKTGAEWLQTVWSEQNYKHVTELICSQEGNTGSSRSPSEVINPTAISLSYGAARCCHVHKQTWAALATGWPHCWRHDTLWCRQVACIPWLGSKIACGGRDMAWVYCPAGWAE